MEKKRERKVDSPGGKIPYADIAVAATADQSVLPGHHGPDTHDMALQRLLILALRVKHMNTSVVEGDDDVLVGEVQAGH